MKKIDFTAITVLDTETTNLLAESAEIVEIAGARWTAQDWQIQSTLLGAANGIPPEASAKNNISNKMISGLPVFAQAQAQVCEIINWPHCDYYLAHNAAYDRAVLAKSWAECNKTDWVKIVNDNNRWLCTWRLSQHLLHHDFIDCEYGLNYLRYRLDLPVGELNLHRAADDTYLCAKLFEFLVDYSLENKIIEHNSDHEYWLSLNTLCWSPLPINKWPFGKYRGKLLVDIPNDYYIWAMKNLPALDENHPEYNWDLAENLKMVLEQRIINLD